MRHAITVGMGFGKHNLTDAILQSRTGDVVILDPGEYQADDGFEVGNLEMRGDGNTPADVVVHTTMNVKENCILKLENLTIINDNESNNTCWIPKGGQIAAERVVFSSTAAENYPVVFFKGGSGSFTACEIRHGTSEGTGLYVKEGGSVRLSQCDVTTAYNLGSKIESKVSQIRGNLGVQNNGEFTADTLYLADPSEKRFLVSVTDGSVLTTNGLVAPEGHNDIQIENSRLLAAKSNLDPMHAISIKVKGTHDISLPGADVIVPQPATSTTDEVAENKPEDEPENKPEDKPEEQTPSSEDEPDTNKDADEPKPIPAIDQLHAMIGLTGLKKQVDAFVKVATFNKQRESQGAKTSAQSLHSVFLGNPGTGKTTVARLVAKVMFENGVMPSSNYVEVSRQDLVSQNVGGTAIQTQKVLESALGGVLFIDEAYTLYQGGGVTNWGQEAVDTILKYMEDHRDDLMIIFAGYTKEMQDFMNMNPGLTSRAPNIFNFEDYTPEEIAQIGVMGLQHQDYQFDEAYYTKAVAQAFKADVDNSNGRWVRNFNDKLIQTFVMDLPDDGSADLFTIPNSVIDKMTGGNQDSKDKEVEDLLAELNGMVGLQSVKDFVNQLVDRIKLERKLQDKLPDGDKPTYHMVFTGAPGTGKTTVARIIARLFFNLGILPKDTVSEVSRPDLVGRYVGETEEKTSAVIRNAMGGVLFVDEAYQLAKAGSSNDFGKEAIETFITALENNRDKFVAIFAGYTDDMNDFLEANSGLRSRIPLTLKFDNYSPEEVSQIVTAIITKKWTVNTDLLQQTVVSQYKALPENERSNGRWARNFADTLIANHEKWLSEHLDENPDMDVQHIQDAELAADDSDKEDKESSVEALLGELNGMIGLDNVKHFVNDLVERIRIEQKLKDKLPDGSQPTYHMIFSGSPGTGKTTVARIIAELFYNLGILPKDTVKEVARPDLIGRYIGETEAKTSKVIRNAMGGVLFIDEAYQLTKSGGDNDFGKEAVETLVTELENNRDNFVAIFAGYTKDMQQFLEANEGLRSRIPLTLEFADYTPDEVAQIVTAIITKNWTVNEKLLKSVVISRYKQLPANERSNGRWARNFADKLISQHKLWLGDHMEEPDLDVKHLQDDLLFDSITW